MITVHLHDLLFSGYHGIHDEERVLGNDYIFNASMEFQESTEVITHINHTINYSIIYNIIKRRMAIPTPLLETIVMEIGKEIYLEYPHLKTVRLSLKKLHPPIEGIQGSAGVSWEKTF